MAGSKAALTADEISLAAADKPMILARNYMTDSGTSAKWTSDGNDGSADDSATGFETKYVKDNFDHKLSKPTTARTTQYLNINFGAGFASDVDAIVIMNHNLGTISGVGVTVKVADDAAFSSGLKTIYTVTPTTNKRIVAISLLEGGDPSAQRFTAYRYMRVEFNKGSTITPSIGEILVIRRRQLKHKPNVPYDPSAMISDVSVFKSATKAMAAYVRSKGQRRLSAMINPHETAYITDVLTWFNTDTDYGTKPFLWLEDPTTSPSDAVWYRLNDASLAFPGVGFTEREVQIVAEEMGPNFLSAGV